MTKIALQLAIFVVAAVPGYLLAIAFLDRVGHRRLQLTGFAVMALCFAVIAVVPGMTTMVVPFLLVYGVSYFFTEFGPNVTTFVIPSEVFPVTMRATGHGISAGIGKLGAFIGVFLFPVLQSSLGLRGTLLLTAAVSVLGFALTRVLPETSGRSLDDIADASANGRSAPPPTVDRRPHRCGRPIKPLHRARPTSRQRRYWWPTSRPRRKHSCLLSLDLRGQRTQCVAWAVSVRALLDARFRKATARWKPSPTG
jgi:MFS family permease